MLESAGVPTDSSTELQMARQLPYSKCERSTSRSSRPKDNRLHLFVLSLAFFELLLTEATAVRAAWRDNKNISDSKVLEQVLNDAGFAGQKLVLDITTGGKAEVCLFSFFHGQPATDGQRQR
jgi:hypothetical protein